MNILVLTMEGFQDIELISFIGTLNTSGRIKKITYWNPDGLNSVVGSQKIGIINTVSNQININEYDAIFIPGGKACIKMRINENAIKVIKLFIEHDKYIFAICDAPNVIVESKLLLDKKYTSYPIENIEKNATKLRQKDKNVVVDGKYISGRCPSASIELGLKVIEIIYGKELSDDVWLKLNGGIK